MSAYFTPATVTKYGAIIPGICAESNLILILLDKLAVSNFLKYGFNMDAVSEIFTFNAEVLPEETPNALILFESDMVSEAIRSDTYCVLASKPVRGKLILLAPVVVILISPTPLKFKFCASVMVLPSLFTPVPPLDPGTIVLIDNAESATEAFVANNAYGTDQS